MTLKQQHLEAIKLFMPSNAAFVPQAATACEAITRERMGKFAEWINDKYVMNDNGEWVDYYENLIAVTTSELIDLYFESTNK